LISYLAIIVFSAVYGALIVQIDALAHGRSCHGVKYSVWFEATAVRYRRDSCSRYGYSGTIFLIVPGIYLWGIFQLALIPVL
jgi:hypothetical protein